MPESIRLLFAYRDGRYVPLPPQRVRMISLHPPATRGETPAKGRYVELRSADGTPIQSVYVGDSGPPRVEFPTGDEEQPFGRTEPPPGSIVSVVVAADERAAEAVLVDVTPGRAFGEMVRRDLAVVRLDEGGDR